jgi:hypothetical protein
MAPASLSLDSSCEKRIRKAARPMNIEVMTGLTRPQVDALISEVALEVPMLSPTKPYRPGLADSVVIVLILLRKNWTQDEAAAVWDCSQPTISRRWELLRGPIAAALAPFVPHPAEAVHGDTVLIDGTLAPTSDWQHREDLFSGKHMRPGYNLQVACLLDGTLIGIGDPVPGCHHDTYAWRDCGLADALTGVELLADLGYEHEPGFTTGVKRLPGRPLTKTDWERNHGIAGIRVVIEKTIAHLKTWRIIGHPYRGPLDTYPEVINAVRALHFYRLSGHPLPRNE